MKIFTIALLGATLALAGPVMAQDRGDARDKPVCSTAWCAITATNGITNPKRKSIRPPKT